MSSSVTSVSISTITKLFVNHNKPFVTSTGYLIPLVSFQPKPDWFPFFSSYTIFRITSDSEFDIANHSGARYKMKQENMWQSVDARSSEQGRCDITFIIIIFHLDSFSILKIVVEMYNRTFLLNFYIFSCFMCFQSARRSVNAISCSFPKFDWFWTSTKKNVLNTRTLTSNSFIEGKQCNGRLLQTIFLHID